MAANMMMEILRKIQRDLTEQKDYMKNLHVIHRNINEKFNHMTEKFDQLQVTMERLEQQVKKNNTLLFGNDESESDIFKDNTAASCIPHLDHNESLKQSEKYLERNEANQLQTINKEAHIEEMESTSEDYSFENNRQQKPDTEDAREFIDIANDMREIKDLIADFVKTGKTLFEETVSVHNQKTQVSPTYFSTEQVGQLNGDLKLIITEITDIKELLTRKSSVDQAATPPEKNNVQTVQISPAYFSAEQISKLNSELKRITETYQTSNIFPNIEVVADTSPSDDHPVMKALRTGVFYEAKNNSLAHYLESYGIKLGTSGFKKSNLRDLLTEYPDLTLYEVVKEGLKSTNEWSELSKIYDFTCPHSEPRKVRCLETVQISPTYFDADQIIKLNGELKQIAEKYQKTNILPNIEVVPFTRNFDNHPVVKAISQRPGILVHRAQNYQVAFKGSPEYINSYTRGFELSGVKEILKREPLITVYDFLKKHYGGDNELACKYFVPVVPG